MTPGVRIDVASVPKRRQAESAPRSFLMTQAARRLARSSVSGGNSFKPPDHPVLCIHGVECRVLEVFTKYGGGGMPPLLD